MRHNHEIIELSLDRRVFKLEFLEVHQLDEFSWENGTVDLAIALL